MNEITFNLEVKSGRDNVLENSIIFLPIKLECLPVLASFPIALINYPDKTKLRQKGFILVYNSRYSPVWWGNLDSKCLKQVVMSQPPQKQKNVSAQICPWLSIFYMVKDPTKRIALPRVGDLVQW